MDDSNSFPNGVITPNKLRVDGLLSANNGIQVDGKPVIDNNAGWHRTYGNTGWYNATYKGGFFMQDSSWVRSYKDKGIYTGGKIQSGSQMNSPKYCDSNGNNCTAAANLGGASLDVVHVSVSGPVRSLLTASCPSGYKVSGGGFITPYNTYSYQSYALNDTQWRCATYDLGCSVWGDCRSYNYTCSAVCNK